MIANQYGFSIWAFGFDRYSDFVMAVACEESLPMFAFADEEDILIVVFDEEIRERVHVTCVHGRDCLIEVIFGSIFKDFCDHKFVP